MAAPPNFEKYKLEAAGLEAWTVSDPVEGSDSIKVTLSRPRSLSVASCARNLRPRSTSSSKRKASAQASSKGKKPNLEMDIDAIKAAIEASQVTIVEQLRGEIDNSKKAVVESFESTTSRIEKCLDDIVAGNIKRDEQIEKLTERMDGLHTEIVEEIKADMRKELDTSRHEAFKATLIREIEKASHNLIIFGFGGGSEKEEILSLFDASGVEDVGNLIISKTSKLGLPKGKGEKVNPILVIFADPTHRNNVLKAGTGFPKGVTIERDIPPQFRERYKAFKKHAWKLRSFYNVKTQIVFNGHLMQLRYREEEKSFTIIDEYCPPIQSLNKPPPKGNSSKGNGPPSTVIKGNGFCEETACSVLIVMNRKIQNKQHFYDLISPPVISEKVMRSIENLKINEYNCVVVMADQDAAKRLAMNLKDKVIGGIKVHAETFGTAY